MIKELIKDKKGIIPFNPIISLLFLVGLPLIIIYFWLSLWNHNFLRYLLILASGLILIFVPTIIDFIENKILDIKEKKKKMIKELIKDKRGIIGGCFIDWERILMNIIFICGTLLIILLAVSLSMKAMNEANTYIQCCNGSQCTDTYYTSQDNLCHLSLCEGSPLIFNKSKCVYEGANISVNLSEGAT